MVLAYEAEIRSVYMVFVFMKKIMAKKIFNNYPVDEKTRLA